MPCPSQRRGSTRLEIRTQPYRTALGPCFGDESAVGPNMSTTLTGPPGTCCWTAIKHTGDSVGRVESLGGLDTYISEPPANAVSGPDRKVLLFFADAYGPLFINGKLLQDHFAAQGLFFVIGIPGTSFH